MNTDKLKEEILGLSFYPHECGSMIDCVTKQDALNAMDSHAEQISILFADWLNKNSYNSYDSNGKNCGWNLHDGMDGNIYTTNQLYQLFIKHLNEQK